MGTAKLFGYRRKDGRFGIRNFVAVMAAADNVNPLARRLAAEVPGAVCLPASYGRGQLGSDLEVTLSTMAGLAAHPNVAAVLIVSFEPESAFRISERVAALGRSAETLSLLEAGGMSRAVRAGRDVLGRLSAAAQAEKREPFSVRELVVGLECGGSDTSSGVIANPALGMISDRLIDLGAATIFSEPLECIGCESALAQRAVNRQTAAAIGAAIEKYKKIALDQGVDLTGVNPTADNMAGGLSTIEEKSLGAVSKSGTAPIQGVLAYGERPPGEGLWFMDAPAAAVENLTALAAAGCQAIFFSTGSVNPAGHPIAPTLKVCANPAAVSRMAEHVDADLSGGIDGTLNMEACRDLLYELLVKVINGHAVAAERLGYLETNISRFGQSV